MRFESQLSSVTLSAQEMWVWEVQRGRRGEIREAFKPWRIIEYRGDLMKSVCVPRKTFLTFAQFDFCQLFAAVSSGEKVLQCTHIPQLEQGMIWQVWACRQATDERTHVKSVRRVWCQKGTFVKKHKKQRLRVPLLTDHSTEGWRRLCRRDYFASLQVTCVCACC